MRAEGQPAACICLAELQLLCLVCNILPRWVAVWQRQHVWISYGLSICHYLWQRYRRAEGGCELGWGDEISLILRWVFCTKAVDSFCLQIQYLNPHQCNIRLRRATDWSSCSVCVQITHLSGTYAGVIYSICVCVCACIQLLLPSFIEELLMSWEQTKKPRVMRYKNIHTASAINWQVKNCLNQTQLGGREHQAVEESFKLVALQ